MNIEKVKNNLRDLRAMEEFVKSLDTVKAKNLTITLSESIDIAAIAQSGDPFDFMMGDGMANKASAILDLPNMEMKPFVAVLKETISRRIVELHQIIRNGILGIQKHGKSNDQTMDEIIDGLMQEIAEENQPKEKRVATFKAIGNEVILSGKYVTTGKSTTVTIEKGPGEYTELSGHELTSIWIEEGSLSEDTLRYIDEDEVARDLEFVFGSIGPIKILDINLLK